MNPFDTHVVVDWSARATPSPAKPSADAIWIAVARGDDVQCDYLRTRHAAAQLLCDLFAGELQAGRRVVAGFDFPFAYPVGFARKITGADDPLALWDWLARHVEDGADNANNRFDVARKLNAMFPGTGPFWGCPAGTGDAILPDKGSARTGHGLPERRHVETLVPKAQPGWKLFTTGSVGSQALLGIPRLQALRRQFGAELAVAPFQTADSQTPDAPLVLMELFPSILASDIAQRQGVDEIKDRAQVRVMAQVLARLSASDMDRLLRAGDPVEGWIFGAGEVATLQAALPPMAAKPSVAPKASKAPVPPMAPKAPKPPMAPVPPPLRDDCFALPAGVNWIPVDDALAHLRDRLSVQVGVETVPLSQATGRILAQDITALRSNPPHANTAVDGYGFAGGREAGAHVLPLVEARAAAGDVAAAVPKGHAIRILTGAALPDGVDTVILQEDVAVAGGQVAFRGPVKPGANTRRAGEDVREGQIILTQGRRLTPADMALAAATGQGALPVRARLKVGVLSTGDELREAGSDAGPGQIYDANRPLLLSLLEQWGLSAVDLGHVRDDRMALRARLDAAVGEVQAILTSGGASAGDEDHVSALLEQAGAMGLWRVAMKPGRPLALGLWGGVPVFGLPGNPVAAMVCSLVFARPALGVLAGAGWRSPAGMDLPAAFSKSKKPGRREYLRARLRDGRVEVFASEGSGRISGLSWAEGLVELPEPALDIAPGDPVRYIPLSSF